VAGDELDEALEVLEDRGPEFGGGLSNHGPMAAEALVALGRASEVPAFVSAYRPRLDRRPRPGSPLAPDEWARSLGDFGRSADWVAFFDCILGERPVASVVAEWVPRLAPGTVGAGTHGLIRTAHALRSLERAGPGGGVGGEPRGDEVPAASLRRRELAEGLGYWAARYRELPGPPLLVGSDDVARAVGRVPMLPEEAPRERLIGDQAAHVRMVGAAFEQAVASLAAPGNLPRTLGEMAAVGARAYLANAGSGHEIALVHTVTAPMALDLVLAYLLPSDRLSVFAYGWQAVAAVHAAFATNRATGDASAGAADPDVPDRGVPEEVVTRAISTGNEHAIKMVEACRRAAAVTGDPVLALAAADVAARLG